MEQFSAVSVGIEIEEEEQRWPMMAHNGTLFDVMPPPEVNEPKNCWSRRRRRRS